MKKKFIFVFVLVATVLLASFAYIGNTTKESDLLAQKSSVETEYITSHINGYDTPTYQNGENIEIDKFDAIALNVPDSIYISERFAK